MQAPTIRVSYDELQQAAEQFGNAAESNRRMKQSLLQSVQALQNGGWVGRGADSFFREMNGDIFPALDRLIHALEESRTVTLRAIDIYREAEEDGAHPFGVLQEPEKRPPKADILGDDAGSWSDDVWRLLGKTAVDWEGFPKSLGKDLIPILSLLSKMEEIQGLAELVPLLSIAFEGMLNPDGDVLQSMGSKALEKFAALYGPARAVLLGNDLLQLQWQLERWESEKMWQWRIRDSELREDVMTAHDRFYDNLEKLDLDQFTDPLFDAAYHTLITTRMDATRDVWQDPSIWNISKNALSLVLGPAVGPLFLLADDRGAQGALGNDLKKAISGGWDMLQGLADLPESSINYIFTTTVATAVDDQLTYSPNPSWLKNGLRDVADGILDWINTH